MLNIGTRVATVNIVFSISRKMALIERKVLQYTTKSIKLNHCTLSEQLCFYIIKSFCFSLCFCYTLLH